MFYRQIFDLASGKLKLSLTGHVSTVRGLAVSKRQPYLFSCGEDKQVKCWDLEYNKVRRILPRTDRRGMLRGCDIGCLICGCTNNVKRREVSDFIVLCFELMADVW